MGAKLELPVVAPHYFNTIKPLIDDCIRNLASSSFREDPIAGAWYSRATSIISSAYKRHGQVLSAALLECLKMHPRLSIWREDEFKLSAGSLAKVRELQRTESCLLQRIRYGECQRKVALDVVVYDADAKTLRSYVVKRGNGYYDAGKKRQIIEDLLRTHMLLRDYGEQLGLDVELAEAKVIFYYGVRSAPEPLSLIGSELDDHFQFSVTELIELANDYFRSQLHKLIDEQGRD
jgi:hypothetical protein